MATSSLFSVTPIKLTTKPLLISSSNPKPLRILFPSRNPKPPIRFAASQNDETPPPNRIADEWGEKSDPEPEFTSQPDPPVNDDEWGDDSRPVARVTDEWGEKSDPDPEPPSQADPTTNEDECESNGSAAVPEPEPEPEVDDRLGDLKRCLVDTLYGTEYGLGASAETRAEIFELVSQLESENPNRAPNEASGILDGNWILLYTAFSELLPLVALGTIPLLKVKQISQAIDSGSKTIVNATTLSSPFATFSFSATASFEVQSPSRIQVKFKEGAFQPPKISSSVDLPENVEVFGQKINLSPIQQYLNPLQEAVANIARSISGQPPLKVPIPGDRAASWLLTTYLDEDFRISRGDGGLFVLAKEGSPSLDQLS